MSLLNINDRGNLGGGKVTVTTAQPTGSITADSHGKVTGSLNPGALSSTGMISGTLGGIIDAGAGGALGAPGGAGGTGTGSPGTITVGYDTLRLSSRHCGFEGVTGL